MAVAARGETAMHKTLKKEACRWLYRMGYRCIAAEVKLPPLGIIDSVGTGVFGPYFNHLKDGRTRPQVCFVECKASRGDFLRDLSHDGQLELALMERSGNSKRRYRRKTLRQRIGLGKFDACLAQPMANLHYVLAPAGLLKKEEIPHRWGLLVLGDNGISVVKVATWQEIACQAFVESQIARTLTNDTYRADDRAMGSVNREIAYQQQLLAEKIVALKAQLCIPIEQRMRDAEERAAELMPPIVTDVPQVQEAIASMSTAVSTVRATTTMTAAISPVPLAIDRPIRRLRRR